jgi:hypothetical protein
MTFSCLRRSKTFDQLEVLDIDLTSQVWQHLFQVDHPPPPLATICAMTSSESLSSQQSVVHTGNSLHHIYSEVHHSKDTLCLDVRELPCMDWLKREGELNRLD